MDTIRSKEKERAIRDAMASEYEQWIIRTKGELWDSIEKDTILRAVGPASNDIILDVGCGVGRHSILMAERAKEVISIDFSLKSLDILRDKVARGGIFNIKILGCDITQPLPLVSQSVDKILCSQVLQHVPTAHNRLAILSEFFRILKPGGLLVLIVYRWGGAIKSSKEGFFQNGLYRYAFTTRECRELITEAGFSKPRTRGMINIPRIRLIPKPFWEMVIKIDLLLQSVWLSNFFGKLFLITGRKLYV